MKRPLVASSFVNLALDLDRNQLISIESPVKHRRSHLKPQKHPFHSLSSQIQTKTVECPKKFLPGLGSVGDSIVDACWHESRPVLLVGMKDKCLICMVDPTTLETRTLFECLEVKGDHIKSVAWINSSFQRFEFESNGSFAADCVKLSRSCFGPSSSPAMNPNSFALVTNCGRVKVYVPIDADMRIESVPAAAHYEYETQLDLGDGVDGSVALCRIIHTSRCKFLVAVQSNINPLEIQIHQVAINMLRSSASPSKLPSLHLQSAESKSVKVLDILSNHRGQSIDIIAIYHLLSDGQITQSVISKSTLTVSGSLTSSNPTLFNSPNPILNCALCINRLVVCLNEGTVLTLNTKDLSIISSQTCIAARNPRILFSLNNCFAIILGKKRGVSSIVPLLDSPVDIKQKTCLLAQKIVLAILNRREPTDVLWLVKDFVCKATVTNGTIQRTKTVAVMEDLIRHILQFSAHISISHEWQTGIWPLFHSKVDILNESELGPVALALLVFTRELFLLFPGFDTQVDSLSALLRLHEIRREIIRRSDDSPHSINITLSDIRQGGKPKLVKFKLDSNVSVLARHSVWFIGLLSFISKEMYVFVNLKCVPLPAQAKDPYAIPSHFNRPSLAWFCFHPVVVNMLLDMCVLVVSLRVQLKLYAEQARVRYKSHMEDVKGSGKMLVDADINLECLAAFNDIEIAVENGSVKLDMFVKLLSELKAHSIAVEKSNSSQPISKQMHQMNLMHMMLCGRIPGSSDLTAWFQFFESTNESLNGEFQSKLEDIRGSFKKHRDGVFASLQKAFQSTTGAKNPWTDGEAWIRMPREQLFPLRIDQ